MIDDEERKECLLPAEVSSLLNGKNDIQSVYESSTISSDNRVKRNYFNPDYTSDDSRD